MLNTKNAPSLLHTSLHLILIIVATPLLWSTLPKVLIGMILIVWLDWLIPYIWQHFMSTERVRQTNTPNLWHQLRSQIQSIGGIYVYLLIILSADIAWSITYGFIDQLSPVKGILMDIPCIVGLTLLALIFSVFKQNLTSLFHHCKAWTQTIRWHLFVLGACASLCIILGPWAWHGYAYGYLPALFTLQSIQPLHLIRALLTTPLQTLYEEILYRMLPYHALEMDYKSSSIIKQLGFIVLTCLWFISRHPHYVAQGYLYAMFAVGINGFFWAILTLQTHGIEITWAMHWVHNVAAILSIPIKKIAGIKPLRVQQLICQTALFTMSSIGAYCCKKAQPSTKKLPDPMTINESGAFNATTNLAY